MNKLTVLAFFCGIVIGGAVGKDDLCYETVDIMFIVDSSGSIGPYDFQKQLQFAANFVDRFSVGAARFSVLRFDSSPTIIFGFGAYLDKTQLKNAILSIAYAGGGTDTAAALRLAGVHAFDLTQGARPSVPKILIVSTDGMSNNPNQTIEEAKNLKNASALVMAIGVGPNANKQELDAIASFPADVFVVIDYNQLVSVVQDYSELVCQEVKLFVCYNDADVYFLVDSSTGISQGDFQNELSYVQNVTSRFKLPNFSFGTAVFGATVQRIFRLGELKDHSSIAQALSAASPVPGAINLGLALRYIPDNSVFEPKSGGRVNATKILVILTDGGSTSSAQDKLRAATLRDSGVFMIAVGVSHPNITELQNLVNHTVLDVVANLVYPNLTAGRIETLAALQLCKAPKEPVRNVTNYCSTNNLENGVHPHPFDCTKFIMCTYLKTYVISCPEDLGYDISIKSCNNIGNVLACKSIKRP